MRAARLVLRAVARAGGRLDRPMLERAEALLRRLRMGMPLGTEFDLRALLRAPPVDAGVLITALEGVVPAGPSSREENRFRPLIAIEFRPLARAGAGPAGATSG